MHRMRLASALAVTALLGGCAGSTAQSTLGATTGSSSVTSSTVSAAPSPAATSAAATLKPSTPARPVLSGFGATTDGWAAAHTPDTRFDAGAVWDPTPGLGESDDNDARFFALSSVSGVVDSFSMRFPHGSTQAEATAQARGTLPSDTRIVWQKKFDTCYAVQFRSKTLGLVLADPKIGDPSGGVQFVFSSDEANAGEPVYEPRNVSDAIALLSTDKSPSDFAGC